jgi:hypothetical protein
MTNRGYVFLGVRDVHVTGEGALSGSAGGALRLQAVRRGLRTGIARLLIE